MKWGAVLDLPDKESITYSDYWSQQDRVLHINIKEAKALVYAIRAAKTWVNSARVTAKVDSKVVQAAWEREGGTSRELNDAIKELFWATVEANIALKLVYVESASNPADAPSRSLSKLDARLHPEL
ncbi:hypothetical protein Bbelb_281730 [Branchiostoma belcheri]|nr:hypothetical protein Bbelb_281730 [Branchiostoma belcheri]